VEMGVEVSAEVDVAVGGRVAVPARAGAHARHRP